MFLCLYVFLIIQKRKLELAYLKILTMRQILILLATTLFTSSLFAQTIVPVAPGNGTLNEAIENYIEANGGVDDSVIFQLEDGGIYVLTATLDFDFDLNIQAAPNYEVRPAILPTRSEERRVRKKSRSRR